MPVTESPAQVLDCKGLQCPLPVIKTAQAIKTIEPGQVLCIARNRAAHNQAKFAEEIALRGQK